MFVILVGPPGTGKSQGINPMTRFLRRSKAVQLAPNDVSKQGLLDVMAKAGRAVLLNDRPYEYHFMTICADELANFMSKYDLPLTGMLTNLYDCTDENDEYKRSGHGKSIINPGLSFIIGTATQNLGNTISTEMWGSGFMARIMLIFSAEKIVPPDIFARPPDIADQGDAIVHGLSAVGDLKGEMLWTPGARQKLQYFIENQDELEAPIHNRLTIYNTRRWFHITKLSMIAALSELRMEVREGDFDTAMGWMLNAETDMPEIFKDMQHHEDGNIHEELRAEMFMIYIRSGRKPIPYSLLIKWLSTRVTSMAIPRFVDVAIGADFFRRLAGTGVDNEMLLVPQPPKGFRDKGRV